MNYCFFLVLIGYLKTENKDMDDGMMLTHYLHNRGIGRPQVDTRTPNDENIHLQVIYPRCEICALPFHDKETLKQHMLSIHGRNYPQFCFDCGKGFKSYPGLYKHNKMFHNEGEDCPACHICGRAFPYKSSLERHMNSHTRLKPYKCFSCGKSYKYGQTLKEHVCS